jgi:hypothetical protein
MLVDIRILSKSCTIFYCLQLYLCYIYVNLEQLYLKDMLAFVVYYFNYNFTIIVAHAFNYLKNATTWEQCSVELQPKIDLCSTVTNIDGL